MRRWVFQKLVSCLKPVFLVLFFLVSQVNDLLSDSPGQDDSLDVRENPDGTFFVPQLTRHFVTTKQEFYQLFDRGNRQRNTAATVMNERSSRSHSILTLYIERSMSHQSSDGAKQSLIAAKLNFVDLAGSERLTTSATDKIGKESININQSLSCLANVISALTDPSGAPKHVPYRDSKLTRLLKDSLGGNAKTCMIACLCCEQVFSSTSHLTLPFFSSS